ncbi:hypothetical protein HYC85_030312 [Camellia sinensis]|uniref:Uncharacterized protein n=1 Tax=Camellia sinensis TaxID=4442 RepID=A0A7J7G1V2_CAMSI|nr:hypothetical protein HYC85_030312 [Camellia sinensis]
MVVMIRGGDEQHHGWVTRESLEKDVLPSERDVPVVWRVVRLRDKREREKKGVLKFKNWKVRLRDKEMRVYRESRCCLASWFVVKIAIKDKIDYFSHSKQNIAFNP